MGKKKTLKDKSRSFIGSIWKEFKPILRHGVVTGLLLAMVGGLDFLSERLFSTEFAKSIHKIDQVLYTVIILFLGISTVIQLLKIISRHTMEFIRQNSEYALEIRNKIVELITLKPNDVVKLEPPVKGGQDAPVKPESTD